MTERFIPDDHHPRPPDAERIERAIAANPWVASMTPTALTFKDGMPFSEWCAIGRLLFELALAHANAGEGDR